MKRLVVLLLALGALMLLAACGSENKNAKDNGQPDSDTAGGSAAQTANIDTLRPSAPVPLDGDYRDDPAALVAATGNPQLVEFYTVW